MPITNAIFSFASISAAAAKPVAQSRAHSRRLTVARRWSKPPGCLDRCAGGPVAVVYPEAVWYSYVDASDIDEIVESHLKNGQVVERLLTPPHLGR